MAKRTAWTAQVRNLCVRAQCFCVAAATMAGCHGAGLGPSAVPLVQQIPTRVGSATTGGAVRILYPFAGQPDGAAPTAGVVSDASGNLYGTTFVGGSAEKCSSPAGIGCGTVFELKRTGKKYVESILHSFKGGSDGVSPFAPLTVGSNGKFFGTTQYGGSAGLGVVFELTPADGDHVTILYSFKGGSDGAYPLGSVMVDAGGAVYGTTLGGGGVTCAGSSGGGCGTVYKLTPTRRGYSESVLYAFEDGTDGGFPYAFVIADAHGALYGTTRSGGANCKMETDGCGTVFKLTPNSSGYTERVLYAFRGGKDGALPKAGLYADASGALYGTTATGGIVAGACQFALKSPSCGTVFKLTPSGGGYRESILYRFKGSSASTGDGAWPRSTLVPGKGGVFYGTTAEGGDGYCEGPSTAGCGTVFELKPQGKNYSERVLHSFTSGHDGDGPYYGLLLRGGILYGTTVGGGKPTPYGKCTQSISGCGTVFSIKP